MTNSSLLHEHRTWLEIDSSAFHHNVLSLFTLIGSNTDLGVVLKSDAYGHGLELVGKLCQENRYISWLFTAGLKEAILLRLSGITKPILVLTYCDDDADALIDYHITCVIADVHTADKLSRRALQRQKKIAVHIKIDSGMCRLGFQVESLEAVGQHLALFHGLEVTGIFTHLSDTNNSDYSFTKNQLQFFDDAVNQLQKLFNKKLYRHALASGAVHLPERYDCVRIGTNVYGYWKSPLQQQRLSSLDVTITLKPILTWKTRILALKDIHSGGAVGYHRAFIATAPMKIAILPVGYYDGYPRLLSHKASVMVRNIYAPIIGIISMNSMVIDVTHIGSVRIDDEVILCGNFPGLGAHDLAAMTESIQNEFLTRISPIIPRILI